MTDTAVRGSTSAGAPESGLLRLVPGLALAGAVAAVAWAVAALEIRLLGHPVVEALVLAIVIGMLVRSAWTPPAATRTGVQFAAKGVLEFAVLLLGLSVDLPLLLRAGPALAISIVLLVVLGLGLGYLIARAVGLPRQLAVLVACGNAICGNSAIAAVAPVIDADAEQVVSSIAFTAILGVFVVIGLPFLVQPLGLSFYQYGVLTGLTVYAVPQVLAASFPVSALSGQVATLVKLVRVLMLGPVVLFFALLQRRMRRTAIASMPMRGALPSVSFRITQFVPWFILGFMVLAALRALGAVPLPLITPVRSVSTWLTVLAMAALGLGVDLRVIARTGRPILLAATASMVTLLLLSVGLIHLLGIQ